MGISSFLVNAMAMAGGFELALRFKRRPPMILMYHGVSTENASGGLRNCEGKHMPVELFRAHLRALRRYCRVVSLDEMIRGLRDDEDMHNTVAITFDDGYENNATTAAPVLADFNMSGAFFLTTGFIGTERCIWTDRLEMAMDRTLHDRIQLPRRAETAPIRTVAEKRRALLRIKAVLKAESARDLDDTVESLISQLGVAHIETEGDYRFMSWGQARQLVNAGFEVGAHTISHPILTRVSLAEAAAEILGSRDKVQQETGQCSSTFCFPNGKMSDFNSQIKELCHSHFAAALSSERGFATVEDIYQLKRLSPAGRGKGENIQWVLLRAH